MRPRTLMVIASILIGAIGTALVGLYVRTADQRALSNVSSVRVWTTSTPIRAGAPGSSILPVGQMYLRGSVPPGVIAGAADIQGKFALQPIQPGQPLLRAMFGANAQRSAEGTVGASADHVVVPLKLTDSAALYVLRKGDVVTLVATTETRTAVVAPRVKVVQVSKTAETPSLMVEAEPTVAIRIVAASRSGTIDALLPGSAADIPANLDTSTSD